MPRPPTSSPRRTGVALGLQAGIATSVSPSSSCSRHTCRPAPCGLRGSQQMSFPWPGEQFCYPNAAFVWIPLCRWRLLPGRCEVARSSQRPPQFESLHQETWLTLLYIMTFGTFSALAISAPHGHLYGTQLRLGGRRPALNAHRRLPTCRTWPPSSSSARSSAAGPRCSSPRSPTVLAGAILALISAGLIASIAVTIPALTLDTILRCLSATSATSSSLLAIFLLPASQRSTFSRCDELRASPGRWRHRLDRLHRGLRPSSSGFGLTIMSPTTST